MAKTIIFIHGMFQNGQSWSQWVNYFEQLGYDCLAPSWPDHEGEPASLRENPPKSLGDLRLDDVISKYETIIAGLDEKPIVIGHSVGGLVAQVLANRNLVRLAVPIATVAPNKMLTLDWNFFTNSVKIANPLKGDEPIFTDFESFHGSFCNTLAAEQARAAFEKSAVHDSRNILRDCMMKPGEIDLDLPHAPLLLIGASEDKIIPEKLVEKNSKAYKDETSITDYREFANRSHYICCEPGWEKVAAYVADWLSKNEQDAVGSGIVAEQHS